MNITELDAYLDAAPRPDCDAFDVGPFTLFVSRTPWSYYARPRHGHTDPITPKDLGALAHACHEHGVDLALEWVHETHPELVDIAAQSGLAVNSHALMYAGPSDIRSPQTSGAALRIAGAADPALVDALAVAEVAFAAGGSRSATQGLAERDGCRSHLASDLIAHTRDRARRGLTVTAIADCGDGVVAAGSYQPLGHLAEVLAVATLPAARRHGLAAQLTIYLADHAFTAGIDTLMLSAEDANVERLYARLGFERVGTSYAAEPARNARAETTQPTATANEPCGEDPEAATNAPRR